MKTKIFQTLLAGESGVALRLPPHSISARLARVAGLAVSLLSLCAAGAYAQQGNNRGGGGGGFGGGGFGGFGGGGFNNGNRNNSGNNSSSSSYNNNGTVGGATITVDPDTHNLIVITDEETSQQISKVVSSLDSPKPQVLIKVVFVEVERNDSSDIGIEGGYVHNGYSSALGGAFTNSVANVFGLSGLNGLTTNFNSLGGASSFLSPPAGGQNGFYQIVGSDFQATLRAIATAGKSQILSRPSVLARDGQLAKIVVGQEVPLPTSVSYSASGNTTIPIVNVTYTDVGIILNVTPFIGANGMIEMIVQPQTSTVDPTLSQTIAPGVTAPYLDVRSADTVVVTPDSQTVVIGGLISNIKSSSESKVPFLGDIPYLGALFKTKTKNDNKTELLIFLTPHIIVAPTQLAAMSDRETRQAPAITNSVSEADLDRFLERVPAKKH